MEDNKYKVIKNAIWGAVVAGSIIAYSGFSYLSTKNANETYVERTEATRQILADPGYKEYLEKRSELADKLIQQDPP